MDKNLDFFEENILTPRLTGGRQDNINLLLIGTCQVEHLVSASTRYGFNVDHFLYDGLYAADLPAADRKYDAILSSLTLRTIANSAVEGAHDVFYLQDNWDRARAEEALIRARSFIEASLHKIRDTYPDIPIFAMTLLEPNRNPAGNLIFGSGDVSDIREFVKAINKIIVDTASRIPQTFMLDFNEVMNFVGRAHLHDEALNCITHASIIGSFDDEHDQNRIIPPVSNLEIFDVTDNLPRLHAVIYSLIADNIKILNSIDPIKIIITDLDDTLWRGIAAESDVEPHLRVEGWPLGYQEALLQYRRRGGLLAICSKNDEATTRENFARICGNRLRIEDFVSVKINWKPKSENISEILHEANLLPGNALFIDDNPREIDEVKSHFPTLRCLGGNHHDWRRIILYSPETQVSQISQESSARTQLVRAKIERESSAQSMSRDEWLRSLDLRQEFTLINDLSHPAAQRMIELVNKTNQFNTTGKRWQPSEFADLFAESGCCVITSLRDKNVDNGIIGVAIIRPGELVQTILSCRVFGLGAELALGSVATAVAMADNDHVRGVILDTGKNATCRDYFDRLGYSPFEDGYVTSSIPVLPDWIDTTIAPDIQEMIRHRDFAA